MKTYELKREQFLPIPIHEAWAFFSDPRNLSKITPASLDFRIISTVPQVVHEGLTIEYRVRPLFGIPMTWVSLIKEIQAPYQFVDEQIQGPYAFWHHRHTFQEVQGGVIAADYVRYRLPAGILSDWLNAMIVAKQLKQIFDYRQEVLTQYFPNRG